MKDQGDGDPQRDQRPADPPPQPQVPQITVNLPKETRRVEWLQLALNGCLTLIGVVAICIYGGELYVMKGQLTELIKQYPELEKSANAADFAARIANRNVDDSERFFRLQNRPFVTVSKLEQTTPLQTGDSLITLGAHNSGRTPALKLKIISRVLVANKVIKFNSLRPSESVIASDKEATNTYTLYLSEADANMVRTGGELVFKGTIQYTDIFKEWHSTTFCARYFPKERNYKYCEIGNEVE